MQRRLPSLAVRAHAAQTGVKPAANLRFAASRLSSSEAQGGASSSAVTQQGERRPARGRFAVSALPSTLMDFPTFPGLMRSRFTELMDSIERDFFGDSSGFSSPRPFAPGGGSLWAADMDISESDKDWRFRFDLPGVKKEDVTIKVEGGDTLRISAQRRPEEDSRDETYHRAERSFGYMERAITLPDSAQADSVSASFEDGVLKVTLPKKEEHVPEAKVIPIQ